MSANPLQGETVGETAYRRIRSDIVFGRLAPGEKLKLDRVSETFGVTRVRGQWAHGRLAHAKLLIRLHSFLARVAA